MGNVLQFSNKGPVDPVAADGGGPHDGGMEARVAKLEVAVEYIQRDVAEARSSLAKLSDETAAMRADMAAIKERLEHVPTKLSMWAAVAAVVLPVGAALWWIVQTYLGPILAKAAGG